MKRVFVILCLASLPVSVKTQTTNYPFHQIAQLDSLAKSPSIGRHFGELYFRFLQLVEAKLERSDSSTRRLVRNFEAVFAQFFIEASVAARDGQFIPLEAWAIYFANKNFTPIQYKLLGANAHLNGGLFAAIAGSYTPAEWKTLKKKYRLFNSCLNETYSWVYDEAIATIPRARLLHLFTLGFDKVAGRYYLYKWRKRQMRLAHYWFTGSNKYQSFSEKVKRKKERIDWLILSELYR